MALRADAFRGSNVGNRADSFVMDVSKLELLRQVQIDEPCLADWEAMTGDEQRRHCAQCGCDVHNVEAMNAADADALLTSSERVCLRMMVDDQRNVLTRDGWIPRMVLAVAGCGQTRESGTARVVPPKTVPVAKAPATHESQVKPSETSYWTMGKIGHTLP